MVNGINAMMKNGDDFIGPVNLGNPGEFTIMELARDIIELTHSKSKIIHKPRPADDPERRKPEIALARERLGWNPTVPLEEGLKRTIEYFDAIFDKK
jgi:UDP-glucuronate decarboxylase